MNELAVQAYRFAWPLPLVVGAVLKDTASGKLELRRAGYVE